MSSWLSKFVGLPYLKNGRNETGVDCWGLVLLVYAARAPAISLPSYGEVDASDLLAVSRAVNGGRNAGPWIEVLPKFDRELDVVLMKHRAGGSGRAACHCGVVVAPGLLLHIREATDSVVVPYRAGAPRAPDSATMHSVIGVWRHVELVL